MTRHAATFALGLAAGVLLALLFTSTATSRQPSAPRPAVVTPLAIGNEGTPAADRGADPPAPIPSPSTSTRAARTEAPATAKPSPVPTRKPKPRAATRTGHSLSGTATWYRYTAGEAAAGPRLRAAFPGWRGSTVLVNGVPVLLTDYMGTRNRDKVIDLDDGLFRAICGPLSMGVCDVEVRW